MEEVFEIQKPGNKGNASDEDYQNLKNSIRALYPEGISEGEANKAARNFIEFGKLMLEIKRQRGLDQKDE